LKTSLIAGKDIPKFDKDIVGNILLNTASEPVVREELLIIGIRNDAGEIYRIIGATKSNSYMNAVEELFDLGLIYVVEDDDPPKEGCDAIFAAE
jgi:hypothetical protein